METEQLRTALAVARHRTVNATAAALGVAPSTVSDRVRRLESEVGAPLFQRDPTGMTPTTAARGYLQTAAEALDMLDQATTRLTAARPLTVVAQASITDLILPDVLAELHRRQPELEIVVRPEPDRSKLLDAIAAADADAGVLLDTGTHLGGLGFTHPANTELEHLDLRDIEMLTVAAPTHPFASRAVTRDDVRRSGQLIGREPRCSFWMATTRWLGAETDLTAVGGLAQVREWVTSGRGLAVLPAFTATDDISRGRMIRLDVDIPALTLRLVWRREHQEGSLQPLLYALSQA